ncbi:ArsR/SmtB family transcription factor [Abyssibacter profundi]|uniref:ArsR family transcriptional regulator n=1 Tax=Abyssibacter profundi TaxID=2182787 RepID=A0A363UN18_9GAMM|nr:metalloregulator ArsR/SmtB family transcription factor [Abyssibacter profundi]PWN56835.1 ArsR family transcriptional regulator [Abyssibacter profundi]
METGSLDALTQACRLLADGTRLRLLAVLESDALSVAELTQVTGLAQSRVSSHVSKLREAKLLTDARMGSSTLYSFSPEVGDSLPGALWAALKTRLDDDQIGADLERAREVIRSRHATLSWADSVAGRMELHYSPGRTWEATARALIELLELGDVLDIASGDGVLAELLANHAKTVTCVDLSRNVVEAGRRRLAHHANVRFEQADMHALPFEDAAFSVVFCMHALTYSAAPQQVLAEAARVLEPGGTLVVATLAEHEHAATTRAYDHVNQGFSEFVLRTLLETHQLRVVSCRSGSREQRPPYFQVVIAVARRK